MSDPTNNPFRLLEERVRARRDVSESKRSDGRNLLGFDTPVASMLDGTFGFSGVDGRKRFAHAITDWLGSPRTLRERAMIAFMNTISDKPDWNKKVFDDEIVDKWRKEAIEHEKSQQPEEALSQEMFGYCIAELQDYAKAQETTGFSPAIDADCAVYKSDTVISVVSKRALQNAVAPLEDVEDAHKDWHPDSGNQVLDLVHPSLFPLLYGRSRILPEGTVPLGDSDKYAGKGELIPKPDPETLKVRYFSGLSSWGRQRQHFYSDCFQWLPSEVAFAEGDAVKISSYINNLHPKHHTPLYGAIEDILASTLPLWDATLASTERQNLLRPITRIKVSGHAGYIYPEGQMPEDEDEEPEDEDEEPEDEDAIMEADEERHRANRILPMPEPPNYPAKEPYSHPTLNQGESLFKNNKREEKIGLRNLFAEQGIQVIVKLANIHLTPEKPSYDGGSWHIEGMLNEHICASAIYYYSSENITESYLSFREATRASDYWSDDPPEQDEYEHIERLYGVRQHEPGVQELGKVDTREGRLVVWPNVLQHKVEPFSLADMTRPGHRKILALFLVDPYCRIPSTANVPPQQKEWWREMVQSLDRVADLPPELAENIVDSANEFIDLGEAKKLRLELMEERKAYAQDVDTRIHMEGYNFCEH